MAVTGSDTSVVHQSEPRTASPPTPLDRNALNLPNLITISRLLLSFVLFALIHAHGYWIEAACLFVFAAATDALDGYLARRYGQVTTLGRILDPFVDKIIVGGAFIFLLEKQVQLAAGADPVHSGVTAWMVVIVIGREMFVTSLRGFLEQHGLDFSANWSGKLKMVTQCTAVTVCLLSLNPHFASSGFLLFRDILLWTMVAVTLHSGYVYIIRAAAMLRPPEEETITNDQIPMTK